MVEECNIGLVRSVDGLCDNFDHAKLAPEWKLAASPVADGAIEIYRNRLCVQGRDYKFAAAERPFGLNSARVQVRIERRTRIASASRSSGRMDRLSLPA